MPRWITACFVFFLSLSLLTAKARTVDDILSNCIHAMGGQEKMDSISSVWVEGVFIADSKSAPTAGDSFSIHVLYRPGVSTGPVKQNPDYVVEEMLQRLLEQQKLLRVAASEGGRLQGEVEERAGNASYVLKIAEPDGGIVNYYVDPKSWYIIREERANLNERNKIQATGDGHVIQYASFAKTEKGYIFPRRIYTKGWGTIHIKTIEVIRVGDK